MIVSIMKNYFEDKDVSDIKLFDVDGVLTDFHSKKIAPFLLSHLVKLLENKKTIGINTGRSIVWLKEEIINPLFKAISDKSFFQNLIIVGEKGSVWVSFDNEGNIGKEILKEIFPSKELLDQIKELIEQKYKDYMFIDKTKETMISIEMNNGCDLDKFAKSQKELEIDSIKIINNYPELKNKIRIDSSAIATDIEFKTCGKDLGAKRFLQILKDKHLKIKGQIITFGDSASDLKMADQLFKDGYQVKLIYVGNKEALGYIKKDYPIEFYPGFTKGTIEYLSKNSNS